MLLIILFGIFFFQFQIGFIRCVYFFIQNIGSFFCSLTLVELRLFKFHFLIQNFNRYLLGFPVLMGFNEIFFKWMKCMVSWWFWIFLSTFFFPLDILGNFSLILILIFHYFYSLCRKRRNGSMRKKRGSKIKNCRIIMLVKLRMAIARKFSH